MKQFTERDFRNAVLDRMKGGYIRTSEIIDATWEIAFYIKLKYSTRVGARILNGWLEEYLVPDVPEIKYGKYSTWRLKGHGNAVKNAQRMDAETESQALRSDMR